MSVEAAVIWLSMSVSGAPPDALALLYGQAQADPQAALAQLEASSSGDLRWRELIAAKALHYASDYPASLERLQALQRQVDREADPDLYVAVHRFLGQNHYRLGEMDRALRAALAAEAAAAELGVDDELGHVQNLVGAIYVRTGQMVEALAKLEEALALFRAQNSEGDVAKLENNLAVLYIEVDEFAAAEPHLMASIRLARRLGRATTLVSNLVNLVELRAAQERFDEAAQALEECFEVTAVGRDSAGSRVFCHSAATDLYGRNGELTSAIENTRNGIELAERLGLGQVAMDNEIALAELLARAGEFDQAYQYADAARRRVQVLKDAAIERRLDDAAALNAAAQDRLAVERLEERAAFQRRTQTILVVGLAILLPLLAGAAWLLRLRGRLLVALREERDRSDRLARTDPLTGLPNRRAFEAALATFHDHLREHGRPYVVVMLDIDHFKRINDTRGHAAGDELLIAVGAAIQDAAAASDACGRWGGEEFIVALNGDAAAGDARARAIMAKLAALGADPAVTASFGVAVACEAEDVDRVLLRADTALYASKREGRNRVTVAA